MTGQPILRLSGSGSSQPWTFGFAFRKGDFTPGGLKASTGASAFQADVRNLWDDGSVKYAVLSGISSFSGSTVDVKLDATGTLTGGNNVAEPSTAASVQFSSPATTVQLADARSHGSMAWTKSTAHKVREILGPVMSEFHYYSPVAGDNHLAVWWFVRAYSNGAVEVETVVENGWLNVASPSEKDYSVAVSVGGSSRYSGSLAHYHRSRWSRVDWAGSDPGIKPAHDSDYLMSTRLVPNYGSRSPTSAAFSGLATAKNPTPFALGDWNSPMGNAGYQQTIGLLPRWEALYCSSGDSRAYDATISNFRSGGRWSIHHRDETTGRIPLFQSYSSMCYSSGWGPPPPTGSGGSNTWDIPHHPSNGYLAYLVEGRWSQLEELQFTATWTVMDTNPATRFGGGVLACINAPLTTRGAAWAWRTVGQAAGISPTYGNLAAADIAVSNQYSASVANTATWAKGRYVTGTLDGGAHVNNIGWLGQYDHYTGGSIPGNEWWGGAWMVAFQAQALGFISDLGIDAPDLAAMRDHSYDHIMRVLGTDATWNFRRGAAYSMPFLKNSSSPGSPDFMTTQEAFASYRTTYGLSALGSSAGSALKAHSSDSDMAVGDTSDAEIGFWAQFLCALAYAVDHGKPGAAAAQALVASAPNYVRGSSDIPQWSIVPR